MADPVVGIDLGTTFSAVAAVENGKPRLIKSRSGSRLTPSMVGFEPLGGRVVGEAARPLLAEHPGHVAFATKRFIGRRWSAELALSARSVVPYPLIQGPSGEIRISLAGRVLPLTQVSAMILGELKLDAEAYFGRPVKKAVITVPANFDEAQRQATKESAQIAGLEVLRIVNEPTAAAVAYGLASGFKGRSLVFDLGGGTFDVSILEVQDGVFEVKATGGDPHLGGEDFDNRIVQWLLAQVPQTHREAAAQDPITLQKLKIAAEQAKRELSESEEAQIFIDGAGDHGRAHLVDFDTALTRPFFETLSEPLSRRCLSVCERVMADAGLSAGAIDAVLMVGGMSRVPLIRKLVTDYFGKEPVSGLNPDEVVALGAAVHAFELAAQSGSALLLDVASHSLGVEMLGGKVRRLIPKNSSIPVTAGEVFHPGASGQTQARIRVCQGESEVASENTFLGEVLLRELSGRHRGDVPIQVSFELSGEGMLSVKAVDLSTGAAEALTVRARTELSPRELRELQKEQGAYATAQGQKDFDQTRGGFSQLLEKGKQLLGVLEVSTHESPSAEASQAVASVKALLDSGRSALRTQDQTGMADVARQLTALTQ